MCLPGTAAIPAVHADRLRAAEATGALAVRMIGSQLTPDKIVNRQSVENALRVLLAIGGSTNDVIHLTAIAGRDATILTGGSVGVSLKDRAVAVVAAAKASIKRGDDESA